MPLKKWRSMDIFNFSPRENPIMESISNKFAEISQSHAGTLLRNRRLGSLGSVKSNSDTDPPKKEDATDSTTQPMLQRTAIIQKDDKGYGLTVSGDNPVYVASIKSGGAAEKAGVQIGDKIIKVNGKHVIHANHTEVVHMIRAGSYVVLTLLGKPSSSHSTNRESIIERDPSSSSSFRESSGSFRESSGSFRDSILDKITGPQPVDAEKERDFQKQKLNTIRVMYDAAHEDYEKLKKDYKNNPSDTKLQTQITEKEKTLKILEAQLNTFQGGTNRDTQPPSINVDSEDTTPRSSLTASVPATVSDLGSDSPCTSPSTSPTPLHSQNLDIDPITGDSGIEDGSQNSIVMSNKQASLIIGQDDDDFASEDESTGESKVFSDLKLLETKPAHMAIFLHYVLTNKDPAPLLFYQLSHLYNTAQGSTKDLKKWAFEIYSTFIVDTAPLKVTSIKPYIVQEIDTTLSFRSEREESLRTIFARAREVATEDVQKLLDDLRIKKEKGLIEGSCELQDHMDKNTELKIVEKYLLQDLETISARSEEDDKMAAQSWAIATFLRQVGLNKPSSHSNVLERVQSFVSKDKKSNRFQFSGKKPKSHKGHQFVLIHLYKQEACIHCNKVLWGVGFQGYQCQTCEQFVHKPCIDLLEDMCSKKKRQKVGNVFRPKSSSHGNTLRSALSEMIPATPMISDQDVGSPTSTNVPGVFPQPLKEPEDKEINAFREGGHSVESLRGRFENTSPENEPTGKSNRFGSQKRSVGEFSPRHQRKNAIVPRSNRRPSGQTSGRSLTLPTGFEIPRKNSDIGRSESMKGRGDVRDRPAKRSNSDLAMDENTMRALNNDKSSSNSSLRTLESPSGSMDILQSELQYDSDFDVESELPTLKQVLGDDTVKKLRPKEKKRQDVINELFYTEKCHVRNLKIMDKLFYKPMMKETAISKEFTKSLFPNLETMIALHGSLNDSMKNRRKEKAVIANVGDILLERFDGEAGENFRNGCAIFCRNQSHTLENLKIKVRKDLKLAQLLADAEYNPLCQRLALKDIIPKQFMRLTKYPLLIENLLKYTQTNTEEHTNLERAQKCSKHILEYVNQAVKDCENHQRLIDLQRRIDKKNIDNTPDMDELRDFDLSHNKLIHDGTLTWSLGRKQIELHVVLLERAMVLLQKQDDRLVLKLQSTQLVAGKADSSKKHSPLLWLNNVLARNDATDKKAFFVVNTSKSGPQIYKLVAGTVEEQKTWTKHITQASDFMKKNEINMKKKPPVQEEPAVNNTLEPGSENGELQDLESGTLVQPEDVTVINPDVQEITPLEKLRQNDETLAAVLEERQGLLAELLNVKPIEVPEKVEDVVEGSDGMPQELIAACQHQTSEIVNMIRENTPPTTAANNDPGEVVETVDDLSLPIPMDRLKDMANRMNQILTNLLAQTRVTGVSTPMSQAAVNSRDEERDRLRKELKFAQEELNRLRRIKQKQMEAEKDKEGGENEGERSEGERPASMVSETTVSESDDNKDDSELTDEQETVVYDDNMPGLPIEPDLISECENLNEVSPGTMDTLVDTEQALDLAETSGTDMEESGTYEEADVEAVVEELHEVEPAEEDQMEDIEPPTVEIIGPDSEVDSDAESDDDDDNDDNNNLNMETNENISGNDSNDSNNGDDNNSSIENDADNVGGTNGGESDGNSDDKTETVVEQDNGKDNDGTVDTVADGGKVEDVMDRLKLDDSVSDSDTNSDKKESGETFHDAVGDSKIDDDNLDSTELTEDPGGPSSDSDSKTIGTDNEKETDSDTKPADDNKHTSNNNIEIDTDLELVQKQKDPVNTDIVEPVSESKDTVNETDTGVAESSTDQA